MEDQVPFKAYAFWGGQSKPEVRRFGVEKSVVTSFHYLNAKLQEVYSGLKNKTYTVAWKDEDGDDVTISSDDEVMIALGQMEHGDLIKLYIYCKDADNDPKDAECEVLLESFPAAFSTAEPAGGDNKAEHFGVVCDGCDSQVVGFRYKCASCDDFDLCSSCEAAGKHPAHCMVRIPVPAMPHAIIKAAIKRSRHFLKTVALKEECPYKRHKRERSAERKQHRDNDNHRGVRRERRECRRQQRGSWLETFATYMNEFANLAGDVDCHPPTDQTKPQPSTSTQTASNETQAEQTEATPQESQGEKRNGGGTPKAQKQIHITGCPIQFDKIINPENIQRFMELQKTLTEILIPNVVPIPSENVEKQPSSTSSENVEKQPSSSSSENVEKQPSSSSSENVEKQPTPAPSKAEPTPASSVTNDVDMAANERQSVESDKISVHSEGSNRSNDSKFADPEKADDWTVINKEHDLMDMFGARPSAPVAPATPIGFNLPQEFQRVTINDGQQLYPQLNAATAVLNPKEPEPQPLPPKEQPTPAPQSAPAQQPTPAQPPRHPKLHIALATDQMIAMGFNNDGGWLSQLLDNYDGNISAVVELLTPVQKKK